jgi:FAD/FMN-containing dehydrogenase
MVWLESFGRVQKGEFGSVDERLIGNQILLPFGNGRSYGDTCLPPENGAVIKFRPKPLIQFQADTGVLTADAHASLSEIILHCGPMGWFIPVTPGTKYVTLGGAIANDVHGKNHHVRGSFGAHVLWFDLARSDGQVMRCSEHENASFFAATIGGMGLTGLISRAAIQMMKVPSVNITETTKPFSSLPEYFDLAEAADRDNEYAVAWIDQLAGGKSAGRGLLFAGNHASDGAFTPHRLNPRISVPFVPPINVLNGLSVRAFNTAYRAAKSRKLGPATTHYDPFFYPLDMVGNWNRFYGPRGLHQHQSVIPFDAAQTIIPAMLQKTREAGQVSFLTVLKRFGDVKSPAILSFARAGYTLTLDFPHKGASTLALLNKLDAMTIDAGGAVNPYKDSRMPAQVFERSFPNWRELEALRDPQFVSGFWARTALVLAGK